MSRNWTYNEGKALISVYAGRKDEYFKTKNKEHFWENVLTELESQDVLVAPTTIENVEVKWRSLYRAYKNAKDRGTGSTPTKILYMDEMDDIFRSNPIVCSKTAVSVGMETQPKPAPMRVLENSEIYDAEVSAMPNNKNKRGKKQTNQNYKERSLELKKKIL